MSLIPAAWVDVWWIKRGVRDIALRAFVGLQLFLTHDFYTFSCLAKTRCVYLQWKETPEETFSIQLILLFRILLCVNIGVLEPHTHTHTQTQKDWGQVP